MVSQGRFRPIINQLGSGLSFLGISLDSLLCDSYWVRNWPEVVLNRKIWESEQVRPTRCVCVVVCWEMVTGPRLGYGVAERGRVGWGWTAGRNSWERARFHSFPRRTNLRPITHPEGIHIQQHLYSTILTYNFNTHGQMPPWSSISSF